MENQQEQMNNMKCPKCGKPMYEDPMFASGAFSMISGSGKELINGGMAKETRMLCDDCPHCEYVKVGEMPSMVD